jgi:hypothetical protein
VLSTIVLISAFMFDVVQTGQAGAAITNWTVTTNPAPSGSGLGDVTCLSATACIAVGDDTSSSGIAQTLVESWDGTSWSIVPSPNQGTLGSFLNGVT